MDFRCYVSHNDFWWVLNYGLAYGAIAAIAMSLEMPVTFILYGLLAGVFAVMYNAYDHWCNNHGATYVFRARIWMNRNFRYSHGGGWMRYWYCN